MCKAAEYVLELPSSDYLCPLFRAPDIVFDSVNVHYCILCYDESMCNLYVALVDGTTKSIAFASAVVPHPGEDARMPDRNELVEATVKVLFEEFEGAARLAEALAEVFRKYWGRETSHGDRLGLEGQVQEP